MVPSRVVSLFTSLDRSCDENSTFHEASVFIVVLLVRNDVTGRILLKSIRRVAATVSVGTARHVSLARLALTLSFPTPRLVQHLNPGGVPSWRGEKMSIQKRRRRESRRCVNISTNR